jgi:hypothetical protein
MWIRLDLWLRIPEFLKTQLVIANTEFLKTRFKMLSWILSLYWLNSNCDQKTRFKSWSWVLSFLRHNWNCDLKSRVSKDSIWIVITDPNLLIRICKSNPYKRFNLTWLVRMSVRILHPYLTKPKQNLFTTKRSETRFRFLFFSFLLRIEKQMMTNESVSRENICARIPFFHIFSLIGVQ